MTKAKKKPTILVSSTVYGIEELLDRIYTILTTFGYEVWMSHKGTLPVQSNKSAFANCLHAVGECDLFLGIITPTYGTGKEGSDLSIVHKEINQAIKLNKPRWLLAHEQVVFARRLLSDLGHGKPQQRRKLQLKDSAKSITDLRVIDMYEEAILHAEPLSERNGNWVQKFSTDEDALLFASAQFSRFQEVERFIQENMANPDSANTQTKIRKGDVK
ncbi:MAG: DUF4062 domain-containing protein [Desulfuromonadales bacterium]|nr:DUF4062 domain-containing protein [Desulfuromonadales bacterium]